MKKEILEWIVCFFIAVVLAIILRYYVVTPTIVKHSSMYPTFVQNERLILNRTFRIFHKEPSYGDIITFEAPQGSYTKENCNQSNPIAVYDKTDKSVLSKFVYNVLEISKKSYIKRVIALAGDHVEIKENSVFINGEKLNENYIDENVVTESEVFNDFVVPKGYIFAMGDNRENSLDCRNIGCIPVEKVEGYVLFRFWPLNRIKVF